ncbi:MAG: beta-lactamase family protein [Candidatus Brocadiae bacterium]|nr:beta-lactamase family protein [Candidatus Brocadiia bacterium]
MKKFFFLFFLSSLLFAQNPGLEKVLLQIQDTYSVAGMSVLVIKGDDIVFSQGFGHRDIERKLEVNALTKYRVASVSKIVTATALMQLYEKGLFKMEDEVSPYLGFTLINPHFPEQKITFASLLSHTSSLRDASTYSDFLQATLKETPTPHVQEILTTKGKYYAQDIFSANHGPKEQYFQYANINFGVAACLVEKLSHEFFHEYCKKYIFLPLGLNCSFQVQDIPDINDIAVLYRKGKDGWVAQADKYQGIRPPKRDLSQYQYGSNAFLFAPQGGLRASAEDLAKILILHKNGGIYKNIRILQENTAKLMRKSLWNFDGSNGDTENNIFQNYGLSLHTTQDLLPGQTLTGHPGEAYGLLSGLYFSTTGNYGIIFITNGAVWGKGNHSGWYNLEEDVFKACMEKEIVQ